MAPPDDAPLHERISRALDWWFTPRWRALLTWLALAPLTFAALEVFGVKKFFDVITSPLDLFDRASPEPLPPLVRQLAFTVNFALLFCWFEPFALRLTLPRGAAWLALRVAAYVALNSTLDPPEHWEFLVPQLLFASAAALALRGWRSRPWMGVVGVALSGVALISIGKTVYRLSNWLVVMVWVFPFAATLLYGTRLLSAEERARSWLRAKPVREAE